MKDNSSIVSFNNWVKITTPNDYSERKTDQKWQTQRWGLTYWVFFMRHVNSWNKWQLKMTGDCARWHRFVLPRRNWMKLLKNYLKFSRVSHPNKLMRVFYNWRDVPSKLIHTTWIENLQIWILNIIEVRKAYQWYFIRETTVFKENTWIYCLFGRICAQKWNFNNWQFIIHILPLV